jgi:hypothetical protein
MDYELTGLLRFAGSLLGQYAAFAEHGGAQEYIESGKGPKGSRALAYVFSHRPARGVGVETYEDSLRQFHELSKGLKRFRRLEHVQDRKRLQRLVFARGSAGDGRVE